MCVPSLIFIGIRFIMKKLSLLLIISLSFLSACEADNTSEKSTNISSPASNEASTTTDNSTAALTPAPIATITASSEPTTAEGDNGDAESLHTENCTRCHGTDVYTRTDRKVTSLDALGAQVRMCDSQLETQLFPEDMEKLTQYLNTMYYKF